MKQEKRGQADLNTSSVLPLECNFCTRDQFEAMGIVYGDPVDDLFIEATLPDGWKTQPTSHSMWSDLIDDKGRVRAAIFYKAAFYDRTAHISINRRYSCGYRPITGWGDDYDRETTPFHGAVTDQNVVIWHTEESVKRDDYEGCDRLVAEAEKWLIEHYPDYKNPLSYWD